MISSCYRRSIPACAGEPGQGGRGGCWDGVYPRVCGGTCCRRQNPFPNPGLSPRVRGNPKWETIGVLLAGSIPACAGEPSGRRIATIRWEVYPRVCGGTSLARPAQRLAQGLSPRVRGNRLAQFDGAAHFRSIPACAGEPVIRCWASSRREVYPRVCGGTCHQSPGSSWVSGLSPRVRGNHLLYQAPGGEWGSIPACAGEPCHFQRRGCGQEVYPRVCGGTVDNPACQHCLQGLSPRVRGNPAQPVPGTRQPRSIPACAGEPPEGGLKSGGRPVYPRVCGGTAKVGRARCEICGLSPRVRGNPQRAHRQRAPGRSIPACAGEPNQSVSLKRVGKVYPRVCGGTSLPQEVPA